MIQVRARFFKGRNSVKARILAWAEADQLRKYEPHPVSFFQSAAQLINGFIVASLLGNNEAMQIEWVAHALALLCD
jgi:uncharacterized damage-inducible protein DinB